MATNQAQGKLSLDLNEARTDVTCHIDCLQLEQLCLFYTLSFTVLHYLLYLLLPSPRFSTPPLPVNLCTILSHLKDFSSSFTLFSFSSTYFLLTVEAWWQFITSSVMQQLPFLLPSPTPPCVQQVPLVLSVKTFDWITIWNYSNFSLNTQHEPQATSRKRRNIVATLRQVAKLINICICPNRIMPSAVARPSGFYSLSQAETLQSR